MKTTDRNIYFKLAEYAQKVFASLDEIDKKTYTAAELAKYMKRDKHGKHICKEPSAVLFRRALEIYFNADIAAATIVEDGFECEVGHDSVWLPLANFEKLAGIPKAEQVKFVAKTKSSVKYRISATLPSDAGIIKNYVESAKKPLRPNMCQAYIDIKNGWMWASDTHKLYGGRVADAELIEGEAPKDKPEQFAVTPKIAEKCAGKTVVITYYEDGSIDCFDGENSILDNIDAHYFINYIGYIGVIPAVNPDTKIKLGKKSLAGFKSFLKTTKSADYSEFVILSVDGKTLTVSRKDMASDKTCVVRLDLEDECKYSIKTAFAYKHLVSMLNDSNGEIWLNGKNRPALFEAKNEASFLMLMPVVTSEISDHPDNFKTTTDYLTLKTEKIMASKTTETPLMQQYAEMKAKHPDAILLFRVGDFYETFKEDAVSVSEILGITLTRRANGAGGYTELAGFPHCSLDTYLPKLVRAGKRVAICEELDDKQKIKKEVEPEEPKVEEPKVEEPKVEEPKVEEPKPAPEPTLKAELRECALAQLPADAEIVAAKYVPIGEDNGKWQIILKKGDAYRYADIVAAARYLYLCDRVFDTAEDVATLVGVELPAPKPAPEIAPESTPTDETTDMVKMFMDEYGMDNDAALMLADKNHALKENLLSEKSVEFTFRKKDGSERVAHGTLHPDVVPEIEHDPSKPERKPNPKFQTYYDLDKQQWRCFEKANLIDVELPF